MDLGIFDSLNTLPEVHNTLRRLICVEYLPIFPVECKRSFRIFKANSRIHLSIAQQSPDDPLEIFDALEKGGKIKLGKYRILKDIAKSADARIVILIEAAEKRMEQIRGQCSISVAFMLINIYTSYFLIESIMHAHALSFCFICIT